MGGGDLNNESQPSDPDYARGREAIKAQNWNEAVQRLSTAVERDPKNPDIHNYLGYAERQRGNLNSAFEHYERALSLDPKHRAAHEYVGEAYLMAGNLPKAEAHLAALDKLCMLSCEEYRELKSKIAEYRQSHR